MICCFCYIVICWCLCLTWTVGRVINGRMLVGIVPKSSQLEPFERASATGFCGHSSSLVMHLAPIPSAQFFSNARFYFWRVILTRFRISYMTQHVIAQYISQTLIISQRAIQHVTQYRLLIRLLYKLYMQDFGQKFLRLTGHFSLDRRKFRFSSL